MRKIVSVRIGLPRFRSICPSGDSSATLPRRATSVSAPAILPGATYRRRRSSSIRPSLSLDSPTSSGETTSMRRVSPRSRPNASPSVGPRGCRLPPHSEAGGAHHEGQALSGRRGRGRRRVARGEEEIAPYGHSDDAYPQPDVGRPRLAFRVLIRLHARGVGAKAAVAVRVAFVPVLQRTNPEVGPSGERRDADAADDPAGRSLGRRNRRFPSIPQGGNRFAGPDDQDARLALGEREDDGLQCATGLPHDHRMLARINRESDAETPAPKFDVVTPHSRL